LIGFDGERRGDSGGTGDDVKAGTGEPVRFCREELDLESGARSY
jgi:hypothetical protein